MSSTYYLSKNVKKWYALILLIVEMKWPRVEFLKVIDFAACIIKKFSWEVNDMWLWASEMTLHEIWLELIQKSPAKTKEKEFINSTPLEGFCEYTNQRTDRFASSWHCTAANGLHTFLWCSIFHGWSYCLTVMLYFENRTIFQSSP